MAERITVSWDEVNSPAVDRKLRQLAVERGAEEPAVEASAGAVWSRFLNNTLVYSTLFGLLGGLLAGLTGEIVQLIRPSALDEYAEYLLAHNELVEEINSGEISESEFERQIAKLDLQYAENPVVALGHDPGLTEEQWEQEFDRIATRDDARSLVNAVYWFAIVGMLLAFCLSIADQATGRNLRGVVVNGSVAIALALAGSLFGACIASIAYSKLGGAQGESFALQILARAIGWGLFGGCLAVAPGVVLKNWKRLLIGLAGGLIGGTLGGALFDPIAELTESAVLSRIVAILVIGTLTGLGTGLLETAARTSWVRVLRGLIAGKQFILYKDTTTIGSSPQCEIYLFKDAAISPRHAAIHKRGSGYELEDLGSATGTYVNGAAVARTRVKRGDRVQIGSTVLMFLQRSRG